MSAFRNSMIAGYLGIVLLAGVALMGCSPDRSPASSATPLPDPKAGVSDNPEYRQKIDLLNKERIEQAENGGSPFPAEAPPTLLPPYRKSVWKEKALRIHLAGGRPPVIVVRPGFATDIEVNFQFRNIIVGDSSWRVRTGRGLEFRRKNIRHLVVRSPRKQGVSHSTNMILIDASGERMYSFTLKEASPSHPEPFNTLVFVSEH